MTSHTHDLSQTIIITGGASGQESYDQHKAAELWEASAELVQLQPMQPSETILQVNSSLKER
jgi:hypothetical protein